MSDYNDHIADLIKTQLSLSVPAAIERLNARGGPTECDLNLALANSPFLHSRGEALIYHVPGDTARAMDLMVQDLALMSFAPGGVEAFGLKFEATREPARLVLDDELFEALEPFRLAMERLAMEPEEQESVEGSVAPPLLEEPKKVHTEDMPLQLKPSVEIKLDAWGILSRLLSEEDTK